MTFDDLPAGSFVLVDANVFVYYYSLDVQYGAACKRLFERIARGEISGFTTTHILADVAHRLMTLEGCSRLGWPMKGIAYRLRSDPEAVQRLVSFRQAMEHFPQLGIQLLGASWSSISAAATVSQQTGLLTNDALIVAMMREHRLSNVASRDTDFDHVPGLTRYAPA